MVVLLRCVLLGACQSVIVCARVRVRVWCRSVCVHVCGCERAVLVEGWGKVVELNPTSLLALELLALLAPQLPCSRVAQQGTHEYLMLSRVHVVAPHGWYDTRRTPDGTRAHCSAGSLWRYPQPQHLWSYPTTASSRL